MVARRSKDLSQWLKGTRVVIGEAPDYVELVFNHFDSTGQRLFADNYVRTTTRVGMRIVNVGTFNKDFGFGIGRCKYPGEGDDDAGWAAPLVVPA